jgi:hypothetical protein
MSDQVNAGMLESQQSEMFLKKFSRTCQKILTEIWYNDK